MVDCAVSISEVRIWSLSWYVVQIAQADTLSAPHTQPTRHFTHDRLKRRRRGKPQQGESLGTSTPLLGGMLGSRKSQDSDTRCHKYPPMNQPSSPPSRSRVIGDRISPICVSRGWRIGGVWVQPSTKVKEKKGRKKGPLNSELSVGRPDSIHLHSSPRGYRSLSLDISQTFVFVRSSAAVPKEKSAWKDLRGGMRRKLNASAWRVALLDT
jgi:hypothetical protein